MQIWLALGKCKAKPYRSMTLYPLDGNNNNNSNSNHNKMKRTSVKEDVEELEVSYIIGKKVNWYIHCGKRSVSQKAKHKVIIWPNNPTSRDIHQIIEYKDTNENLYANDYKNIIHNSQKVEPIQMSF